MEERTKRNPLMYKAAMLYKELQNADELLASIIVTLKECTPSSNFITEIGEKYIISMPKFKILEQEAVELKQNLRKVCSGEVSVERALVAAEKMRKWVDEALCVFNREQILPYMDRK